MTTIFEQIDDALATLNVPYAENLYLLETGDTLPDLYLVATLISGVAEQHADDDETARSYRVQISVYSHNGLVELPDVDGAMKAAGFVKGPERELPYDQETGHFGLALDYVYLN
jgi:aminoglycoside phosphotransferase (APT) family kinase protein